MSISSITPLEKTRIEHGQWFTWNWRLGFWYNTGVRPGKNPVQVFPPEGSRTSWWIVVPKEEEFIEIAGVNAEARSFAVAVGLINQKS